MSPFWIWQQTALTQVLAHRQATWHSGVRGFLNFDWIAVDLPVTHVRWQIIGLKCSLGLPRTLMKLGHRSQWSKSSTEMEKFPSLALWHMWGYSFSKMMLRRYPDLVVAILSKSWSENVPDWSTIKNTLTINANGLHYKGTYILYTFEYVLSIAWWPASIRASVKKECIFLNFPKKHARSIFCVSGTCR